MRALYQMKNIEIGERTSLYELVDGRGPRSGRDLVFRCYPPELLPPQKKQKLTFWVSFVSGDPVRITPVIFRTGLRRWRFFSCHPSDRITSLALRFPFPYHGLSYERGQKRFLRSQKAFFVRSSPLRERALDGRVPYEKSTQLPLSAFALS